MLDAFLSFIKAIIGTKLLKKWDLYKNRHRGISLAKKITVTVTKSINLLVYNDYLALLGSVVYWLNTPSNYGSYLYAWALQFYCIP